MAKRISADMLQPLGSGNIVDELLDLKVQELESILGSDAAQGMGNQVLALFVQNGARLQLTEDQIASELFNKRQIRRATVEQMLRSMEDAHLLRKTNTGRYELSNNTLAQRAYQKVEAENRVLRSMRATLRDRMSRNEMLNENYLGYITPYLDRLELNEEELGFVQESREQIRRSKNRRSLLFTLAFLFLLGLSAMTGWASWHSMKANKELKVINQQLEASKKEALASKHTADSLANEALDNLDLAWDETKRADSLFKVANANAKLARLEAQRARQNAEQADRERNRAEQQRAKAELNEKKAINAEKEALDAAKKAEIAEKAAQTARQRAINFSNIVVALNAALKSQELDEPRLKSLVARQAYNIINESGDTILPRHPYIYNALYYACKAIDPELKFFRKAHQGGVRDIVFAPNGRRFYTSGSDGKVVEWNIRQWNALGEPTTMRSVLSIESGGVHNCLALDDKGKYLLVGGELPYLQRFELGTRTLERFALPKVKNRTEEVYAVGFDASGQQALAISSNNWLYQMGDQMQASRKVRSGANTFLQHQGLPLPFSVAFNYGDRITEIVLESLQNGKAVREELGTRGIMRQDNYGQITALASEQNAGSGYLALGFQNGQIVLAELAPDKASIKEDGLRRLFKQNQSPIVDLAFSPSGRFLAAASLDGKVTIWDLKIFASEATYQPLVLDDHRSWALSVAFSPDDRYLLVGDKQGNVAFWNMDPQVYAEHICKWFDRNALPTKDRLDENDWQRFFGKNIPQQNICRK
jgi:WD40 repeat protein